MEFHGRKTTPHPRAAAGDYSRRGFGEPTAPRSLAGLGYQPRAGTAKRFPAPRPAPILPDPPPRAPTFTSSHLHEPRPRAYTPAPFRDARAGIPPLRSGGGTRPPHGKLGDTIHFNPHSEVGVRRTQSHDFHAQPLPVPRPTSILPDPPLRAAIFTPSPLPNHA